MTDSTNSPSSAPLGFEQLVHLCRETHAALQTRASRAVDAYLTARNWLLGRYIVEFEQSGADRADYGTQLLGRLSAELGQGFSERSLRLFRAFYLSRKQIGQTLSAELTNHFPLSWSHYSQFQIPMSVASTKSRPRPTIGVCANSSARSTAASLSASP